MNWEHAADRYLHMEVGIGLLGVAPAALDWMVWRNHVLMGDLAVGPKAARWNWVLLCRLWRAPWGLLCGCLGGRRVPDRPRVAAR